MNLFWQPLDQKQLHALLERFLKKDLVNAPLVIRAGSVSGGPARTVSSCSSEDIPGEMESFNFRLASQDPQESSSSVS